MPKLRKYAALTAIKKLAGKNFYNALDRKDAVEELVAETRLIDQKCVATETVVFLLDLTDKEAKRSRLIRDLSTLSLALSVAETYPIKESVAVRLVKTAALSGFHGRFPELPIRLLNRQPIPEEIILLISSYVSDLGSRGESTEQKLKLLAETHLPRDEAIKQIRRLEDFVVEFNRYD
jgi:hypothetical protein